MRNQRAGDNAGQQSDRNAELGERTRWDMYQALDRTRRHQEADECRETGCTVVLARKSHRDTHCKQQTQVRENGIPGGGHRNLAITHEGYNVAEWLSERGIAAFVLKHRLARETNSTYKIELESLADTTRAMRLIRQRAQEWNIDPKRVGAIGFSAGGELVNLVCARFDEGKPDGVMRR